MKTPSLCELWVLAAFGVERTESQFSPRPVKWEQLEIGLQFLLLCPVDMNEMKEWKKSRIQPSQLEQVGRQQSLCISPITSLWEHKGGTTPPSPIPPAHTTGSSWAGEEENNIIQLLLRFFFVCTPVALVSRERGNKLNWCGPRSVDSICVFEKSSSPVLCINLDSPPKFSPVGDE